MTGFTSKISTYPTTASYHAHITTYVSSPTPKPTNSKPKIVYTNTLPHSLSRKASTSTIASTSAASDITLEKAVRGEQEQHQTQKNNSTSSTCTSSKLKQWFAKHESNRKQALAEQKQKQKQKRNSDDRRLGDIGIEVMTDGKDVVYSLPVMTLPRRGI